jgi:hypothetical protein
VSIDKQLNQIAIGAFCGKAEAQTNANNIIDIIKDIDCRWGQLEIIYNINKIPIVYKTNPFQGREVPEYFTEIHENIIGEIEKILKLQNAKI